MQRSDEFTDLIKPLDTRDAQLHPKKGARTPGQASTRN